MSSNAVDPATGTAAKFERRRAKSKAGRKSARNAKPAKDRTSPKLVPGPKRGGRRRRRRSST